MPQEQTSLFNIEEIDISNYQNARTKIQEIDRAKIVEILLTEFQKNIK